MKKFKNFTEMSMSVTLKPKKNNMYKVTKVGDKMKAHGGIKKGEKFHDSDIDGMHDSGIKVKYAKPKKIGEAYEKGRGPTGIAFAIPKGHPDAENPKTRKKYPERQTPEYKANFKSKSKKVFGEAIQRRMDRKTIIATDPATGRKVIKIAPKKEVDIGKGKQESFEVQEAKKKNGLWANIHAKRARGEKMNPKGHKDAPTPAEMKKAQESIEVNELSDTTKVNYINKANKAITDKEKLHLKVGLSNVKDKSLEKRRKGVAMAKSKLGEQEMSDQMKINELKISTMQKYKRAAKADIQTGENARHKGYPEKEIDQRQGKRDKGLDSARRQIAKKQVKMAKGVAFDKRYKGGNMTGATNAINKIKPGLADHPKVSAALKRANEEFNKGE